MEQGHRSITDKQLMALVKQQIADGGNADRGITLVAKYGTCFFDTGYCTNSYRAIRFAGVCGEKTYPAGPNVYDTKGVRDELRRIIALFTLNLINDWSGKNDSVEKTVQVYMQHCFKYGGK